MKRYGIWLAFLLIIVLVTCLILKSKDRKKEVKEETVSILTSKEEDHLQSEAIIVAERCKDLYQDILSVEDTQNIEPEMLSLTKEQRNEIVNRVGDMEKICVSDDINMLHYEKVVDFYKNYKKGEDTQVTVFLVQRTGMIASLTFTCRKGKIQSYYVGVQWQKGGMPELQGTKVNDIKEIKLTEKGYFIYENQYTIAHGNLREYFRVKPLSSRCRELTEKYISGLSYVNYNMLVTNWNSSNVEDILMPCMFEDIYRICTGENLKTEDRKIQAETYEQIMTTCFPVSVEQLRNHCGYDTGSNSYEYEMILAKQFPPFGEVVDYMENGDGTITLFVDGVWPDYNSDCAFTNKIVVEPHEDGTFCYLLNDIEKKELDIPVVEE